MAEDRTNTENPSQTTKPIIREGLVGTDRAKESIKKAQDTGSWPKKETPQSITRTSDTVEKAYPTEKKYPKPEVQEKTLDSFPNQEETIPVEIKKEVVPSTPAQAPEIFKAQGGAEPLRRILKAQEEMDQEGEKTPITTELPKAKTFVEGNVTPLPVQAPETFKAQGGAEPLKRIMKAQEEMDQEKAAYQESAAERMEARVRLSPARIPPEGKDYKLPSQTPRKKPIPQPTIGSAPQEIQQGSKLEQKPFYSRIFRKIFGNE